MFTLVIYMSNVGKQAKGLLFCNLVVSMYDLVQANKSYYLWYFLLWANFKHFELGEMHIIEIAPELSCNSQMPWMKCKASCDLSSTFS